MSALLGAAESEPVDQDVLQLREAMPHPPPAVGSGRLSPGRTAAHLTHAVAVGETAVSAGKTAVGVGKRAVSAGKTVVERGQD